MPIGAPTGRVVAPDVAVAAQLVARLGRCTAGLVPRLADAALRLVHTEGWKSLRFTNVGDFARERLDRSGSWLRQLARLGQACQEMPALDHAITGKDGGKPLSRAAAYEICRVARPETVALWIQRARTGTIRELKAAIRRDQDSAPSSVATTPAPRRWDSWRTHVPAFLPGALLDVERAFEATNPGSRRCDLLEALNAEYASGDGGGMLDVGAEGSPGRTSRSRQPALKALPDRSGVSVVASSTEVDADPVDTSDRDLLQARWTLHHVQMFVEAVDEKATGAPDTSAHSRARSLSKRSGTPAHLAQSMREILALEHEITLRLDRLLLWLDHRRAWPLLGYADAAEFGLKVLDESPSTTRNRLRLARAMEDSAALRHGADSGQVSHQRLVRLSQLMRRSRSHNRNNHNNHIENNDHDERIMREWLEHAPRIRIKRMDEEFDALERRRWANDGEEPPGLPRPLSDEEWQASLRLAPGDARRHLFQGALQALATDAPANVCLRVTAPDDTIRDLRHSLNRARVRLAEQGRRLVEGGQTLSPADESRLVPSIRLAARHVERGTPIPDWICLLAVLEEFVETWDNPRAIPRRPNDAIRARDGYRCTVPGCTERATETHHIEYRSHGGSDDPSNLTSICAFHHRMGEHGGMLQVTGTAPLHLRWKIGDKVFMNERVVDE
jgi:hypothetical protein